MIQITWRAQPQVPQGDEQATTQAVDHWINNSWENWSDGQRVRHTMNVNAPSGQLRVAFILNFTHPEGAPPRATITRCAPPAQGE